MLDTNLCIRVLHDPPAAVRVRFNQQSAALAISTIVLSELLHGAATSARPGENRRDAERMSACPPVLPFDADAAAHAADIRARLQRPGQAIGGYDVLVAGHARSRDLVLVTGNLGECSRVAGLQSEARLADPA